MHMNLYMKMSEGSDIFVRMTKCDILVKNSMTFDMYLSSTKHVLLRT